MNFETPFDCPVNMMGHLGFYLNYDASWRGCLQRCWTLLSLLCLFSGIPYSINVAVHTNEIEKLVVAISDCIMCAESFFFAFTYCIWRKKFTFVMDDIMKILREGELQSTLKTPLSNRSFLSDIHSNRGGIAALSKSTKKYLKIFSSLVLMFFFIDLLPTISDFMFDGNLTPPLNLQWVFRGIA